MAMNDRRLTGRDVLAKTFHAKTKRGYDPIEVDAYLELVAAQIDVLHGDLATVQAVPDAGAVPVPVDTTHLDAEIANLRAANGELEQYRTAAASLHSELEQERSAMATLRAENEQLRTQLSAVAPPPPLAVVETEAPELVVEQSDDGEVSLTRASEESYELVLRMAHRTAEETIAEAHSRADEIVAEAELNATQITKESDRKAFEASNRLQGELASITAEIETQQGELVDVREQTHYQREELRQMAFGILRLADDETSGAANSELVDLRNSPTDAPA